MAKSVAELRGMYPDKNSLSDGEFIYDMWSTHYQVGDNARPMGQFADEVGLSSEGFQEMVAAAKSSGYEPTTSSGPEGPGNEVITGFNQQDQSFIDPNADLTEGGGLATFAQGATMGWSDEIFGHVYAMMESVGGSDLSYDELYTRMSEFERKRLADYADKSPGKAFAAEVGGMVATTFAATPAMLLLKSPKFLMDLSKGMKAFLSSGAVGTLYGAGTGDEGERTENALKIGTFSGFFGFGLQKGGGWVSNRWDKLFNKANQSPTIEALKNLKNEAYQQTRELGIKFESVLLDTYRRIGMYGDEVEGVRIGGAMDEGYDALINRHTASAVQLFDKTLQKWIKKGGATIDQLDTLSRRMWAKLNESGGSEVRIYPLINAIDRMIKSHPDASASMVAAKMANSIYNKAKMLQTEFDKVLNNVDVTGNIGQKYKAAVRSILNNKRLSKFLDENDVAALQGFLKGNLTDKTLKAIGKLSPTSGGLMAVINIGAVAANPFIAIASAIAVASKSSFNIRTSKNAERLMNYIKQFKPTERTVPGVPPTSAVSSGQIMEQLNRE